MLKQYLIRNYEYNKWANEVTIKLIADQNAYGTDWLNYLNNLSDEADLLRIISYKNTKGDFYETPIIDIANHCVGHASYHRAQIMQLLRENGHEPFDTTFITYARLVKHPSV